MILYKFVFSEFNNEDKIIRMPDLHYAPDERGIGHVYFTSMQNHSDKIAQVNNLQIEINNKH